MRPACQGDAGGATDDVSLCAGPFPFAFGSFAALGRGAAHALVHAPGFQRELASLHTLIAAPTNPAAGNTHSTERQQQQQQQQQPLATEDIWLGACLWRFVGQSAPIAIFSLSSEQGHLYVDESSFRVRPYTALWHNRNKFIGRPRLLYLYSRASHCSVRPSWVANTMLAGTAPPRPWGTSGVDAPLGRWYQRWNAFRVDGSYRSLACNASRGTAPPVVDLSDPKVLASLGLLQQLGSASYLRPEAAIKAAQREQWLRARWLRRGGRGPPPKRVAPGRENWPKQYLWQKEGTD